MRTNTYFAKVEECRRLAAGTEDALERACYLAMEREFLDRARLEESAAAFRQPAPGGVGRAGEPAARELLPRMHYTLPGRHIPPKTLAQVAHAKPVRADPARPRPVRRQPVAA